MAEAAALPSDPLQPLHKLARAGVSAYFFANGMITGCWAVLIPVIQKNLGVGESAIGTLIVSGAFGGFAGLMASAWFIARFGSRAVCLLAGLAASPALLAMTLAPSFAAAILAFVYLFLCISVMDVAMNANGADVERTGGKPMMSSFHGFWSLGGMIGSAAGGIALAFLGAFGFVVLAGFVVAGLSMWAAPLLAGKAVQEARESRPGLLARLTLPSSPKLYLFGLIALLAFTAEGSVIDWSAIHLRNALEAEVAQSGFAFAAFSAGMMAGRFSGDALRQRFGASRLFALSALIAASGFLAASLGESVWPAIGGFLLAGIGCANLVPLAFSAAANLPGVRPGTGIAIATMFGYSGLLAPPAAFGFVGEHHGFAVVFAGFSLAILAAMLAAPAFAPRK